VPGGAVSRLGAWWFAPAPPARLAAMRIAIGGFAAVWLAARLPELWAVAQLPAREFAPVGVVRLVGAPLAPAAVMAIAGATLAALVGVVSGVGYRAAAPLAAVGLLWSLSYRCAWGMVFHTDNLVVLHVAVLAVAPAADAWSLGGGGPRAPAAGYGWPIRLLAALTCATYVVAGIAKLRLAGLAWIDGDQLQHQIAIDNLRKIVVGGAAAPLAGLAVRHPAALGALAIGALGLELGAPAALCGGRWARGWALGVWAFHVGVVLTMSVWFPYPLSGVALLPLAAPDTWAARFRRGGACR
jgi:hypothetical protein